MPHRVLDFPFNTCAVALERFPGFPEQPVEAALTVTVGVHQFVQCSASIILDPGKTGPCEVPVDEQHARLAIQRQRAAAGGPRERALLDLDTLLGGLRAVIGTDFIQTIIILLGIAMLCWLAIARIGFDDIHSAVAESRPELLNLLMPAAIMFLFNNLLFGVGEIFHSNVWWSRAFAFREGVGFSAYLTAGAMWMPIPIVAGFIALAVPALGLNVPAADMVGPMVAARLSGALGAVLVFIVVFSALASSLDSLLAATADLILQDIYRGHLRPAAEEKELRVAAKLIILGLGLGAWLLCLPRLTTLAELLYFTGAFVSSTIWPIAAGLYWRRTNAAGATLAMLLGTGAGLYSYFAVGFYVAALTGAAVSMLTVIITTWLRPADFSWQTLRSQAEAGA